MYERRLLRLFFAIAAVLLVVVARAFHVQVVAAADIVRSQETTLRSLRTVYPRRGEILWADGSVAVRNASRCVVRVDARQFFAEREACRSCGAVTVRPYEAQDPRKPPKAKVPPEPAPCRECGAPGPGEPLPGPDVGALARVLGSGTAVPQLRERLDAVRRAYDERQWRSIDLLPGVKLPRDVALALAARVAEFPGIDVRTEPFRESDEEIRDLAGRADAALDTDVAELTSETRELDGRHRYTRDEVLRLLIGRSGFERRFDEQFRGVPGVVERLPAREGAGSPGEAVVRPVVDGTPLRTTLVRAVQAVANDVVAVRDAPSKSAVVLDVRDGAIVAVASRSDDAYFHAILGVAPGSVFKIVPALAMLEAGIDPAATLDCRRKGQIRPGVPYTCTGEHPGADLSTAFAQSCNHFFMRRAEDVGADRMADAYTRLGFDVTPKLGLGVATNLGVVRDFRTQTAQLGIGQAHALSSPLQVATAYARLASRGRRIVPYLDRDAGPAPGSREVDPVVARHADRLIDAARRVVTEGTAHRVVELDALEAAGKSGTAEVVVGGGQRKHHAWFAGFAPASAPRYVAVVVHEFVDGHGASDAGPDVARLLEAALRER
jgi:cell division protein FtsI/penicillin-binding protein 2